MIDINESPVTTIEEIRQIIHKLTDYQATGLTPDDLCALIISGKGKLMLENIRLKERVKSLEQSLDDERDTNRRLRESLDEWILI